MRRTLRDEILDTLPPGHPDAIRSRRDLRWINAVMGNWSWLARMLQLHRRAGERMIEIGAGDGAFAAWWAQRDGAAADYCGLDRLPRPAGCPAGSSWIQADAREFSGWREFPVIIANLVLHHFHPEELARLGEDWRAGGTRLIVACEPARARLHLWQSRLLALTGLGRVTRHDAPVSVAAGFSGRELPLLLGLQPREWQVEVASGFRGAYRMVASRLPR